MGRGFQLNGHNSSIEKVTEKTVPIEKPSPCPLPEGEGSSPFGRGRREAAGEGLPPLFFSGGRSAGKARSGWRWGSTLTNLGPVDPQTVGVFAREKAPL